MPLKLPMKNRLKPLDLRLERKDVLSEFWVKKCDNGLIYK
jgi:hypothetical protein